MAAAVAAMSYVGCAQTVYIATDVDAGAPPSPPLVGTDSDAGADAKVDTHVAAQCIATECPAPFATCTNGGLDTSYTCGTNLLTDRNNCGECGNVCPNWGTSPIST